MFDTDHIVLKCEFLASFLSVLRYIVLTCGNRKPTHLPPVRAIPIGAGQRFDHGESLRRRSQAEPNLTEYSYPPVSECDWEGTAGPPS
jgi:hypothetical protein